VGLPLRSETRDLVGRRNLIEVLDRRHRITTMATTDRGEHTRQSISSDDSVARGLLDREGLLQMLDRAVTKRVTVVSAPPGSGKTSLLRAWTRRSTSVRRVAFVSVDRDQQDAQRFWSRVLDAILGSARSVGAQPQPAAIASAALMR
jgi:ATP/maltotriose-dependent transcriptional regulator MalT